jgi:hypothetical protein
MFIQDLSYAFLNVTEFICARAAAALSESEDVQITAPIARTAAAVRIEPIIIL